MKTSPDAEIVVEMNRPAMARHDLANDAQAQTRAAFLSLIARIGLSKSLNLKPAVAILRLEENRANSEA
jgi:hypothetical protein